MAVQQVNPNRMELLRLKKKLVTARRGHKLLKDKRDELMRQFLDIAKLNEKLRRKMEELLVTANREMVLARASMQPAVLESALMSGREDLALSVDFKNIMSVNVPVFSMPKGSEGITQALPYGMAGTSGELDQAITALKEVFPVMMELAQVEKTAQLLAGEIEKTRRRVNSLEYVMIPNLQESIRTITMKMDENERGNLTRLMKVKDMMVEQARQAALMKNKA